MWVKNCAIRRDRLGGAHCDSIFDHFIFGSPRSNLYHGSERECLIDKLLARIHYIIAMIGWTGLAP